MTDPAFYRWRLDLIRQFTNSPVWKINEFKLTEQEDRDARALYAKGAPPPVAAYFMKRVHGWQERA